MTKPTKTSARARSSALLTRARTKRRELIARARARAKAMLQQARVRGDKLITAAIARGDKLVADAQKASVKPKSRKKASATMNRNERLVSDNIDKFLAAVRAEAKGESPGALLAVRAVRERAALPKEEFDAIALKLSRDGRLVLHYHDFPSSLSKGQRDALIRDPKGSYYVGMAFPARTAAKPPAKKSA